MTRKLVLLTPIHNSFPLPVQFLRMKMDFETEYSYRLVQCKMYNVQCAPYTCISIFNLRNLNHPSCFMFLLK